MQTGQSRLYAAARLVVVQATPFCNINCSYCYLPNRTDTSQISRSTISQIVSRLLEWRNLSSKVTVLWHSGEPLVLQPSFYADAFSEFNRLEELGVTVTHAVQTNATLVTDQHCDLFREHRVSVGVSIDGQARAHDEFRQTRSGKGTYEAVVRGIRRMQARSVFPSAIAVLSRRSMLDPIGFYEAFANLNIEFVGLNIQEKEGSNSLTYIGDTDPIDELYTSFLRSIFRLSLQRSTVLFREFITTLDFIEKQVQVQNSESTPGDILAFSHDGKLGTYSPELMDINSHRYGAFALADIYSHTIEEILDCLVNGPIGRAIESGIAKCCARCDFYKLCGGGSPANKLGEHDSFDVDETEHCKFTKRLLIPIVLELVEDAGLRRLAARQLVRFRLRQTGAIDLAADFIADEVATT